MSIVDTEDKIFEDAYDKTIIDIVCSGNPDYLGWYEQLNDAIQSGRVKNSNAGVFVVDIVPPGVETHYYVWYKDRPVEFQVSDLKKYPGIGTIIMTGMMSDTIAKSINKNILETLASQDTNPNRVNKINKYLDVSFRFRR